MYRPVRVRLALVAGAVVGMLALVVPVPMAGAASSVPDAAGLGPVHTDPLPAGASLSDPTDTGSLLDRATLAQPASSDEPITAGSTAPVGTPGIRTLSRHVLPSCTGTGADGHRVQVLYVHEAGTPSRFREVLPVLRNEVAEVDDVFALSAAQTGGTRRVRWVHDAACLPVIKEVTVPDGKLGRNFWATVEALGDLGYDDARRKYLMFADANSLCGIGTVMSDARPTGNANDGATASYSRVDANCWSTGTSIAAHELTHNLGGVLAGAPHATSKGHCYDESDLMCYPDGSGVAMRRVCASAQEQLLDCHHDDYFSTAPPAGSFLARSWNTARSSFLDALAGPVVRVVGSAATARTGDQVTFTASSARAVSWVWSSSSTTCRLTPGAAGRAVLVCPSTVSGAVTVTARASEDGTGASAAGSATVTVSKSAAPTAVVTAPATATAGTAFPVGVRTTGRAPYTYAWTAGGCTVSGPATASTTVLCAGAPSVQDRVVSVLVRQADGQGVRAGATVSVAPGSTSPASPAVSSWASVHPLRGGGLGGVLRGAAGEGLGDQQVAVQVQWRGTRTWRTLGRLGTTSGGQAVTVPVQTRAGSFRFVWAGDAAHLPARSPAVYLEVATRLRMTAPSRRHLVGRLPTLGGTPVANAVVLLQRQTGASGRWATVFRTLTGSRGLVSRTVRPQGTSGFRWVFRGEAVHLTAASARLTVR